MTAKLYISIAILMSSGCRLALKPACECEVIRVVSDIQVSREVPVTPRVKAGTDGKFIHIPYHWDSFETPDIQKSF